MAGSLPADEDVRYACDPRPSAGTMLPVSRITSNLVEPAAAEPLRWIGLGNGYCQAVAGERIEYIICRGKPR
jgi:hypothetical protein